MILTAKNSLLSFAVDLLYDIEPPCSTTTTNEIREKLKMKDFYYYRPYSSDLALSDFHVSNYLQNFLASQSFVHDDEVKNLVEERLEKTSTGS